MSSSFKILSVGGIAIRLHITFPLILIWAAIQFGFISDRGVTGAIFGVIVVSLLFVIVTLHELGHSFAARGYGVAVEQIVLLPIGGVAQLAQIPENPVQEFVIAIAGPLVNFVLAIVLGLVALAANIDLTDAQDLIGNLQQASLTFSAILITISVYNIFLALFNLIPAFPMDGGRVLRALLATRLPYTRATAIAVTIGRAMAWLFGLYGFVSGDFFIILLAFFVYMGAGQEGALVEARSILSGLTVRQAYSRQAQTLRPDDTLRGAINLTLSGFQASFPVCDGQTLVGLLTYPKLIKGLEEHGPDTPIRAVMMSDVETVSPDDELFEVQQRFKASQLDALPVVDGGQFVGLITSRDVSEVYSLLSVEPSLLPRT